jgi:outer membrane protein OmpA-like peptidoglycan-associated protein
MHIKSCTLATLLMLSISASALADDAQPDAVKAYLAKRQVVASQDLAGEIGTSGRTSCYIAFVDGTAELDSKSNAQVREIAFLLKDDPDLKIEIAFHATGAGSDGSAKEMAYKRAVALSNALLAHDVKRGRVVAKSSDDPVSVAFNDVFATH